MQPVPATVSDNEEPFEPCPTPLAWQQVVDQCAQQRTTFSVRVADQVVQCWSLGDGPPLYFVNGVLGSSQLMSLTSWLMKDSCRCVLFDLPNGFPSSTRSDAPILSAIAEHFGDERFSIYSSGLGCVTAFERLLNNPETIERIVLQGAYLRCPLSVSERVAAAMGKWIPGVIGSVPGAINMLHRSHFPWFPPYDTSRWVFAANELAGTRTKTLGRRIGALKGFDFSSQLQSVETPTMLVRCEGDSPLQVAAQDELERTLPGVSVEWLHTCGRLPFLTHPHRLKKILQAFLGDAG